MTVRRNLARSQRDGFLAAGLRQNKSRTHMNRNAALQIGKRKRVLAIAAVGSADQLEQRWILIDGNQSSVAERPPCRGKVSCEHPNLAYKWLRHVSLLVLLQMAISNQHLAISS